MPANIAVIMRSKDEMPYIRTTFAMLRRQTEQNFQLFIIDSGSTDGSLEEARRHCEPEQLTRILPGEYIPGKVLNEAIAQTECDLIVLLNADAVPRSENWLELLIRPLLEKEADASYSRQVARPDALFIVRYDYARAYAPGKSDDHFFSAAACAFTRVLWERHHFPNEGYAEDSIWATTCRMFNARFYLVAESVVEHSHNYTLKELYRKRYRHGVSFAKVLGESSLFGRRIYCCAREIVRDLIHACRQREFRTIPYNIAYRVTIHAGLLLGIRKGSR